MKGMLKAEWLKLTTTRSFYGLIAGAIVVALLGALSTTGSAAVETLKGPLHEQSFWIVASMNIGLFALVLGIRSYTEEYRHRTIVHTLFADPHRRRSAVAKGIVSALAAALLAALATAVMSAAALALASAKGGGLEPSGADIEAAGGLLLASGLWALLGVGVGALVRHQVPAIVGGLLWMLVIENLGAGVLGDAGSFLPGRAGFAVAGAVEAGELLAVHTGAALLGTYALAFWLVGLLATRHRDVA